ncbi:hypothetical protein [Paenibacillus hubeiensis]|uniref:hypothetical protein n=1 Tax=Paenibacillus hubeiensis TaxID=3077330 RepID=UPI0031B9D83B
MANQYAIKAWVTGGSYGAGIYEIHKNGSYAGYVNVGKLKDLKLVRRIDHTKKAEAFLNTPDGEAWFLANRRIN